MNHFSATDQTMLSEFAASLDHIAPLPVSTEGVAGQLLDAHAIANRLGLYDAADHIRSMNLQPIRNAEKRLDLGQCFSSLPQARQSQDSTTAQAMRLAIACDIFGLTAASMVLREKYAQKLNAAT